MKNTLKSRCLCRQGVDVPTGLGREAAREAVNSIELWWSKVIEHDLWIYLWWFVVIYKAPYSDLESFVQQYS